jgi:DNA ligase (NAD+)
LFALGIRLVGEPVAKKLARYFGSIENLMAAPIEELTAIDEIGEKIAYSLRNFFESESHQKTIAELRNFGLNFQLDESQMIAKGDSLSGKTFLISGVFANHSRDELKDLIEANGGKNVSGVSAKLNYLVAGDNMGPSKLQKATDLGIKIISEDELLGLINGNISA